MLFRETAILRLSPEDSELKCEMESPFQQFMYLSCILHILILQQINKCMLNIYECYAYATMKCNAMKSWCINIES